MSQRNHRNIAEDDQVQEEIPNRDAVNGCVRFVICREGSKIPIKRTEIVKHLTGLWQLPSNKVGGVLSAANKILKQVYGYKLVQVDGKGGTQYIVVSCEDLSTAPSPLSSSSHRILLNAALTHIFMSGGIVKEDDLWKFLIKANLMEENDQSVKKLFINTFTKQMYLTYGKDGEGELSRHIFGWGQRASEEASKIFFLQRIAQAMDKTPTHWAEQHRIATEEENEDVN